MAIAVTDVATTGLGAFLGTTGTISITTSGTNMMVMAHVVARGTTTSATATWDGNAMTQLVYNDPGNTAHWVFWYPTPTAIIGDIVVLLDSDPTSAILGAIAFSGVDQSDGVDEAGAQDSSFSAVTTHSNTVVSATDNWVVGFVGVTGAFTFLPADEYTTERYDAQSTSGTPNPCSTWCATAEAADASTVCTVQASAAATGPHYSIEINAATTGQTNGRGGQMFFFRNDFEEKLGRIFAPKKTGMLVPEGVAI